MAAGSPDAELARTHERQRLAIELHATVAQSLFAIGVEAGIGLDASDVDARGRALREIGEIVGAARRELYATLTRLNRVPDARELRARLEEAVDGFSRASGVPARLAVTGTARVLGSVQDELVRDTLDEALRNARKHTPPGPDGVREVVAELTYRDDAVRLRVHNDGAPRPAHPDPDRADGAGCLGMLAARSTQLRGRLDLELSHEEGGGAVLLLELPMSTTEEGRT